LFYLYINGTTQKQRILAENQLEKRDPYIKRLSHLPSHTLFQDIKKSQNLNFPFNIHFTGPTKYKHPNEIPKREREKETSLPCKASSLHLQGRKEPLSSAKPTTNSHSPRTLKSRNLK
jgi:hypothetical protein